MSPDELVAHCIEAGTHLRATHRYVGEPFDRCHGCGKPVLVDPDPAWRDDALCVQADPEMFWPERGDGAHHPAKAICAACPVLIDCGTHGILHEAAGVWGGMTGRERQEIRSRLGITLQTPASAIEQATLRRARVRELADLGWQAREIAAEVDLSTREVHRILSGERAVA